MIQALRRKFILMSLITVTAVIAVVLGGTWCINAVKVNRVMDGFAQLIFENAGQFPAFEGERTPFGGGAPGNPKGGPADGRRTDISAGAQNGYAWEASNAPAPDDFMRSRGFLTPETQFSMRYFVVEQRGNGSLSVQVDNIAAVSETQAEEYAIRILSGSATKGWTGGYRYNVFETAVGQTLVFVDGSMQRAVMRQSMGSLAVTLVGSGIVIMLLIVLFSGRIVRPVAESYEKQKRFITDASHDLKTPLTLILSNLDIVEEETGPSEWIDDMRAEGTNMAEMINRMVELSRMDEGGTRFNRVGINLSLLVSDEAERFEAAARERGLAYETAVEPDVFATADEAAMRRLMSLLLENAVKYCDEGGTVRVALEARRGGSRLTVSNSFAAVGDTQLDQLFERFYRSDKARSAGGGSGIGLSIAAAIAEGHKGTIRAYAADAATIIFEVCL